MKKILLIILFITGVCFAQKYEGMEFYPNGKLKSIKTYKESNDKFELIKSISVYENGQKQDEGTYKDGKMDGLYTWWYENGQKKLEGNYRNGDGSYPDYFDGLPDWKNETPPFGGRNGKWTGWHENGQKEKEGIYVEGKEGGEGISGIRTDRRNMKELIRMGKQMDYGLIGIRVDRKKKKELTRMGN